MEKMKLFKIFALAAATIYSCYGFAQEDITKDAKTFERYMEHFEDQYTILFREPSAGESPVIVKADREANLRRTVPVKFGVHSTNQDIDQLERELGPNVEVLSVLDAINAVRVRTSEQEIVRLQNRSDIRAIEPVQAYTASTVQSNPYFALDRIDEEYPDTPDNTYTYTDTGAGQTIYILDTGLDIGESYVTAEFGSRATFLHDFNSGGTGDGLDCNDHGTPVASVAAGNTYGVAKGAHWSL